MDTKYLIKKGNYWNIRISRPPKSWNLKGEFHAKTKFTSITQARAFRDKYITPLIQSNNTIQALERLQQSILLAQQEENEYIENLKTKLGLNVKPYLLSEMFDIFIEQHKKNGASKSTIQNHLNTINATIAQVGDMRYSELNYNVLNEFKDGYLLKYKGTSFNVRISIIKKVYNYFIKNKLINFDIAVFDRVIIPAVFLKTSKKYITEEEADKMLKAPAITNSSKVGKFESQAIPKIARYTGARLGEICQLTTDDIYYHKGILVLDINDQGGKLLKNKASIRLVPVASKIEDLILQCKKKKRKTIFNKAGSTAAQAGCYLGRYMNLRYKEISKDLHFHQFRSYAISQMANAGVHEMIRKRIVGHADSSVHGSYTEENIKIMLDAVNKIY